MKKTSALLLSATILTVSVLTGCDDESSGDEERFHVVGLWEGVDEVDGGNSLRALIPTGDDSYRMVGRDTWHGPCGYGDPATLISPDLAMVDRALTGTWTLDCQAGDTAETGDRTFQVEYSYDAAAGTLSETLINTDTGLPIDRIPIVFFLANQQPGGVDQFRGLWEGVDEVDGGNSLRTLIQTGDLSYRMVGRDTWHGPCGYGDPATVISPELTLVDGVLAGGWNLDCQANDTTDSGDRSFQVQYSLDSETGILTETLIDRETGLPIDRIPILFFLRGV